MRKILFLTLMSLGLSLSAQKKNEKTVDVLGWEVSQGKLIWSRIYFAESNTINDFIKGLEYLANNSSVFDLSDKNGQSMVGSFSNLSLKFEEFGYNMIDTPFLISRARHSGKIEIEIKEGRYKVIVIDVVSFLNSTQEKGSVYSWNEDFVDKKGQIKAGMKETLILADKNFAQSFDVKSQIQGNKKP